MSLFLFFNVYSSIYIYQFLSRNFCFNIPILQHLSEPCILNHVLTFCFSPGKVSPLGLCTVVSLSLASYNIDCNSDSTTAKCLPRMCPYQLTVYFGTVLMGCSYSEERGYSTGYLYSKRCVYSKS